MLRKLSQRLSYANVVASLALFVALGGTAYAVNTVGSSDIIDGQVKSVDIGNEEIKSSDVKDQSLTTFDVSTFLGADVVDGSLTGADIQDFSISGLDVLDNNLTQDDISDGGVGEREVQDESLTGLDIKNESLGNFDILDNNLLGADIQNGTLTGADVADNTLTGADVTESSLATTTAVGIAGGPGDVTLPDDAYAKVASRVLPAGSYAILASAIVHMGFSGDEFSTARPACELRGPNGAVLGYAGTDVEFTTEDFEDGLRDASLSLNGIVVGVPAGTEVGLYCTIGSSDDLAPRSASGQMVILQFDGTRPF